MRSIARAICGKCGFHGGGNFGVLGIDDAGDFEGRFLVEILGGAVGLLGGEVA